MGQKGEEGAAVRGWERGEGGEWVRVRLERDGQMGGGGDGEDDDVSSRIQELIDLSTVCR